MARVWRHLAVSVVCGFLVVVLSQCKGLKPTAGQACFIGNNKYQCTDPATALLCQNGKWVNMPCRGPKGCSGVGNMQSCDDDLAQAGEACMMSVGGDNIACGTDKLSELVCTAGVWKTTRSCKGPKHCSITGTIVHCDDTMADVGDACVAEPGDDNYACSVDKKIMTECDATSSKFIVSDNCRGQKGCWLEGNKVNCDLSAARIGDKCHLVDNHSCSEDATQEVKCSPQFTWIKQRDCKHGGCKVKNNSVYCD
jgi:hypothetical protein